MNNREIKLIAIKSGFDLVGIASPKPISQATNQYKKWLKLGFNGKMEYMSTGLERRLNPYKILKNAKSIICLAINYYTPDIKIANISEQGEISKYARGKDYHKIIERKMKIFIKNIKNEKLEYKAYVDYGPMLERAYAEKAGIGFIGKSGNLITKEFGSWVFLATIITNLELEFDEPSKFACGACNKCLKACPTGAIVEAKLIDANKCISYQTIENKTTTIPNPIKQKIDRSLFGCDICQNVCPYNQNPQVTKHEEFHPKSGAGNYLELKEILKMTEEEFQKKFTGTPIKRAKLLGLQRNAKAII